MINRIENFDRPEPVDLAQVIEGLLEEVRELRKLRAAYNERVEAGDIEVSEAIQGPVFREMVSLAPLVQAAMILLLPPNVDFSFILWDECYPSIVTGGLCDQDAAVDRMESYIDAIDSGEMESLSDEE